MSDLEDLYQEVILDHNRNPRNFRVIDDATRTVEGFNPLCGDKITVYLRLEGDRIADLSFQGTGCAISQASASVMTTLLRGRTVAEAKHLFERFHHLVTHDADSAEDLTELGELAAMAGVRSFPTRVKCATLAWHTLNNGLEGRIAPASTE